MNTEYYILIGLSIIFLILFVLVIVLLVQVRKLSKRLERFMKGNDGRSLEQNIIALYEDNNSLKADADRIKKNIRVITKKVESSMQKVGLVKYDAFHQMGGQLSFSLCLLDDNNNGFIINSVHSTEGCYCYTKEIKCGESSIDLGVEEAEALSIALGEK